MYEYIYKGKNKESTNAQMGIVGAHCCTSSLFDRAPSSSLLLSQRKDKTFGTYKHKEKRYSNFESQQMRRWKVGVVVSLCKCASKAPTSPLRQMEDKTGFCAHN